MHAVHLSPALSNVCVLFTIPDGACFCCSEAAAHAVATLAEATLQGGGQIVLAETAAAVGALAGDATGTHSLKMRVYQIVTNVANVSKSKLRGTLQ